MQHMGDNNSHLSVFASLCRTGVDALLLHCTLLLATSVGDSGGGNHS